MKLIIADGDVVTMNRPRGARRRFGASSTGAASSPSGRRPRCSPTHPGAIVIDASGCVVTPGMINAHQHLTGDPLVRSCIPDLLAPGASIFEWSVPIHAAHTADDDELSATLSAVESVAERRDDGGRGRHRRPPRPGGARRCRRSASAARSARGAGTSRSGPFAAPSTRSSTASGRSSRPSRAAVWSRAGSRSSATTWPRDELLAGAADLARATGTGMTMHLSPTSSDPERYLARTGRRPVVAPRRPRGARAAPAARPRRVARRRGDRAGAATRTAIAYCPWAYLRLGQGVTRIGPPRRDRRARRPRRARAAMPPNAGDVADILRAAALAAGIARDGRIDPQRFGAHEAFELATIAGAEAIGMADRIGSLEVGKQADLVVHERHELGLVTARRRRPAAGVGHRRALASATCSSPVVRWCATGVRHRRRHRCGERRRRCSSRCSTGPASPSPTSGRTSMPVSADSPYPELKKTHTMAHTGRPWRDYKPPPSAPVWAIIQGVRIVLGAGRRRSTWACSTASSARSDDVRTRWPSDLGVAPTPAHLLRHAGDVRLPRSGRRRVRADRDGRAVPVHRRRRVDGRAGARGARADSRTGDSWPTPCAPVTWRSRSRTIRPPSTGRSSRRRSPRSCGPRPDSGCGSGWARRPGCGCSTSVPGRAPWAIAMLEQSPGHGRRQRPAGRDRRRRPHGHRARRGRSRRVPSRRLPRDRRSSPQRSTWSCSATCAAPRATRRALRWCAAPFDALRPGRAAAARRLLRRQRPQAQPVRRADGPHHAGQHRAAAACSPTPR